VPKDFVMHKFWEMLRPMFDRFYSARRQLNGCILQWKKILQRFDMEHMPWRNSSRIPAASGWGFLLATLFTK